ncbi:hypothetical protein PV327_010980 [Microctonus hyperodae]|uniref:Uncharacterized protein n=1 Tax=Microctonus hyperodae TaxID=165561 RepID=A0AA39FRN7_MICHY|nr:hypothetical protein PV327_010980 [Microctonus hyperodae]
MLDAELLSLLSYPREVMKKSFIVKIKKVNMDTPDTLLTKVQRMSIHNDYMFQEHSQGAELYTELESNHDLHNNVMWYPHEELNTELKSNHDISYLHNNVTWHTLTNQMNYDSCVDTACTKCEYIHDYCGIIIRISTDMSEKANELMMALYHMKRQIEDKSFTDVTHSVVMACETSEESSITKIPFTPEKDVYLIQDLVYSMIHKSNSIFMIAEQLKQFIIDRD